MPLTLAAKDGSPPTTGKALCVQPRGHSVALLAARRLDATTRVRMNMINQTARRDRAKSSHGVQLAEVSPSQFCAFRRWMDRQTLSVTHPACSSPRSAVSAPHSDPLTPAHTTLWYRVRPLSLFRLPLRLSLHHTHTHSVACADTRRPGILLAGTSLHRA